MTDNRRDAEADIQATLGPYAADYDATAIADDLFAVTGSWDFNDVDDDTFWSVTISHDLTAA
ncbi:hypothetical protein HH308_06210 [Gordonia sp. TBRC 11910]|uniref:Uncharacterized protein n=1 Tax=Gordonia asplenii TaxID=2725283 RepID=A0A848KVB5_9ACTN|nr:hypothetical protein [Gordonia asplenii]NMO00805.1 hypothetical protein [Gordonia asplenii]